MAARDATALRAEIASGGDSVTPQLMLKVDLLAVVAPPDDPVVFHLAKLLDEHLLGDGRDRPFQFREAQHLATEEMK